MDDVISRLDVNAKADRQGRKYYHPKARLPLEPVDTPLPAICISGLGGGISIDHIGNEPKTLSYDPLQSSLQIAEFTEHNNLFSSAFNESQLSDEPGHFGRVPLDLRDRLRIVSFLTWWAWIGA